jgi:pyroglutamyl-peptidase
MRVLITGFDPIWGIKKTPSGDLAKLWQQSMISVPGVEVKALVLPQVFRQCTDIVISEIKAFRPQFVVMYGATKKNNPVRFERFGINCEMSVMGDNTKIPVEERQIVLDGPPAYGSTLPIDFLVECVNKSGVHATSSQFAGTHVCNSILYGVRHYIETNRLDVKAGFIHMSFPNEYGVVEDGMWSTASFADLTRASLVTVKALKLWDDMQKKPIIGQ